jgi:hypothetical protein
MNRRNYLTGLCATAGVVAAGMVRGFSQTPRMLEAKHEPEPVREGQEETFKDRAVTLPSGYSVKLVFRGLMAFTHNGGTECKIGFHSKESAKHKHSLRIKIYKPESDCEDMIPNGISVLPGQPLSLEIDKPDKIGGALFFQPPLQGGKFQDSDFRWVVDFESANFYGQPVRKVFSGVYLTQLTVKNALFYAIQKTSSTFRRQTSNGDYVKELGPIAEFIGANIYLKSGGSVKLTAGSEVRTLTKAGGPYEIHFINECKKRGTTAHCSFNPHNLLDPTERNDFYMNYDGIDLTSLGADTPKLELVLAQTGTATWPDICGQEFRANDEAPCSGTGFGGSGWPPYPT